ncbi:YbaB/EbfC family nucleoid-associated protein [Candidatus Peribacteria bacterium]|jgi:DNA-binding protein YbaB|nr:YbaB/EbfC family nucleoid-associated protein [Candidatus Peribacteria bacterium]MBT4021364.1 YbaB/EbfC family nucleoid-associated protein [Candidatus Peribacteria bacterium]MBT4240536.1 YbaB/EbfC family nucleoid-associated protein [Candidatus Peribacteria bacterium]MBT4474412.1 YbaB/EbfC family nucleoid-associated protein [Candidatus Peribacteria bacterium]
MLKKARDMYKMQKEAKKIKKELKSIHIEAEHRGVTVVVSAEMNVVSVNIDSSVPMDMAGEYVKEATNRALSKAQIVSSEKMQGIMGEMGFGG